MLANHPTLGAKKLASKKQTRRLSVAEIEMLGKALAYAEQNHENAVALGVLQSSQVCLSLMLLYLDTKGM